MIFVTVGSQTPFDRLVRAVDNWMLGLGSQSPKVLVQIGTGTYEPNAAPWVRHLPPHEYRHCCQQASLIIAHAGMGTVLTALEFARPLVVLPRSAQLLETRNEHQLATAKWLAQRPGIWVAAKEEELAAAVNAALSASSKLAAVSAQAPLAFVEALKAFIDG